MTVKTGCCYNIDSAVIISRASKAVQSNSAKSSLAVLVCTALLTLLMMTAECFIVGPLSQFLATRRQQIQSKMQNTSVHSI